MKRTIMEQLAGAVERRVLHRDHQWVDDDVTILDAAQAMVDAPRLWWCRTHSQWTLAPSCDGPVTGRMHPNCGWVRVVREDTQ